jgi:GH18 family chitinase
MISGLKKSFSKEGIELLTAALPAFDYRNGYDLDTLKHLFDWMGIMTYDYHGSWTNHAGYNCPLYSTPYDSCGSIDASMKYFVSKGVPTEKLLIGMAFYGRVFDAKAPNSPSSGGDALSYVTAMNYVKNGWEYHWDKDAAVPYLQDVYHRQVATFEDQASVLEKSRYIFKHGLKGTIVWALNFDYDGKSQPLTEAAGYAITSPVSPYLKSDIPGTKNYLFYESNPLIDYTVTPEMKSAYVNVKIYDMLGRVISVPQKGEKPAGRYSVFQSDIPEVNRPGFNYYEVILNGERKTGVIN